MTWKPFYALPNYLGGKRKLCPTIFREIGTFYPARTWQDLTLLDPCAGACSVALYAKAQGMRVIAEAIVVEHPHLQAIAREAVAEANREFIILAKGSQHA